MLVFPRKYLRKINKTYLVAYCFQFFMFGIDFSTFRYMTFISYICVWAACGVLNNLGVPVYLWWFYTRPWISLYVIFTYFRSFRLSFVLTNHWKPDKIGFYFSIERSETRYQNYHNSLIVSLIVTSLIMDDLESNLEITDLRVVPCVNSRFIQPSRVVFKQVRLQFMFENNLEGQRDSSPKLWFG